MNPWRPERVPRDGTGKPDRCCLDVRAPLLPLFLIAAALSAGCQPTVEQPGEAFTATGELVALSGGDGGAASACFTCHGQRGEGDGISTPRLAGLTVGYLQKQLDDYAAQLRPDTIMTPIARRLDREDRRAVAAYYAAMPTPAAEGTPFPAPSLYRVGDPARGLVACATCHGDRAQGVGAGNPALAGQPAAYLLEQLSRWSRAERRNDPREVMIAAVAPLTEPEMRALSAWLATLPASPRPDTDAATVSAAERASEALAASHGIHRPDR